MSTAVWGFVGVVLGGVLTGVTSLFREQLVGRREREAQELEREQVRKDAHDAFQREAILALHEATNSYWQVALEAYRFYKNAAPEPGEPQQEFPSIALSMHAARSRLLLARAKVFDDTLRQLINEFDMQVGTVGSPRGTLVSGPKIPRRNAKERAFADFMARRHAVEQGSGSLVKIGDKVNALLRGLP